MKRINIENPNRLVNFVEKSLTSWKLTYIGRDTAEGTYHYILTDKENNRIKIRVEIHSQTQQMYDPNDFNRHEYVKIYCKDLNVPLARGCTKFLRVEEFKEVRRVFNQIHNAGRQVLQ
jgi:hypothetical protein